MGGHRSAQGAAAEDREEAGEAARPRSLTARGMCPLTRLSKEEMPQSPQASISGPKAAAPCGRKGQSPRSGTGADSAARKHAVAAGEVP